MSRQLTAIDPRNARNFGDNPERVVINAQVNALFEGFARLLEAHLVSAEVLIQENVQLMGAPDELVRLVLVHDKKDNKLSRRIGELQTAFPNADIVILVDADTGEPDWMDLNETSGVQGYIPLDLRLPVLLAAISLVLSGGQFFPVKPSISRHPFGFARGQGGTRNRLDRPEQPEDIEGVGALRPELGGLTAREHQILALLAQGLQNKLIADRMHLSEHTVKVHIHNLMGKLKVTNRTEAAAAFHGSIVHAQAPGHLGGR